MKIHFANPCALAAALVSVFAASGAFASSGAQPSRAQHLPVSCAALAAVPALVDAPAGSPIAYLARSIIEPHGWRLESNAPDHWQGPGVSANIHGLSVADALRALSDAATAAGWQVRTSAHRSECVVRMSFNGSQIPRAPVMAAAANPAQTSTAVPAPVPAPIGTGVGAGAPAATAPTPSEPTPPAPPAPPAPVILAAGQTLSVALAQFVASQGWTLRWGLDYDHFIEADIPLPAGDWQSAVRFLVEAYQAQGGLIGVAPRFATTNRIVYFTKADHAR